MGRRKPRIECRIDGCHNSIIFDRLMCRECWMLLPVKARKAHLRIWRELRQYLVRAQNEPNDMAKANPEAFQMALNNHNRSCRLMEARANRIREGMPPADPPPDPMKEELKELGLI
ncbi:MAG: hypothetical protein OXT06_14635 [Rhodospirillaceae bacterium]|nr:hypothetical protein [Rhodospirillaceae bacterium]